MNKIQALKCQPLRRQTGAIAVMAAVMMTTLLMFLAVVVDTGRLYLEKRSLQKNADLAAMETALRYCRDQGMQLNTNTNGGDSLHDALDQVLARNEAFGLTGFINPAFDDEGDISEQEIENNRVTVLLRKEVYSSIFERLLNPKKANIQLSASATATACEPIAAFSVGTRLASLGSESVVGNVLKGVGLDVEIPGLVDYNGLAGITITPEGLLGALGIPVSADLGVGGLNDLLVAKKVSLAEILDATVELAGKNDLLNLNASLLSTLSSALGITNPDIQLGSDNISNGLFAAITSPAESALNIGIDALGLISTAIGVATSNRAVDIGLDLLPGGLGALAGADITAKVGVIEPPSIGIGGVGTTAYSAQTRVFTHIKLNSDDLLGGALGGLLGNLLGTSVEVDIPLVIDLASAKGEVMDLCTAPLKEQNTPTCPAGEDCADIAVNAQIAKICVGDIDPNNIFSTGDSCDVGLAPQKLFEIELLGSSLIELQPNPPLTLEPLETTGRDDLAVQQMMVVDGNLDIGTTVNNLTDALLAGLLAQTLDTSPPMGNSEREDIAEEIWKEVNGNSCEEGFLNSSGRTCRKQKLEAAEGLIEDTSNGLTGFIGDALLNPVLGLLGSVLTVDLGGILGSVGDLVGGLLEGVGDLLGGLLIGNPCTGGGLFGGFGSNSGCVSELADALEAPSGQSQSNALVFLTGLLLETLKPVLDAIGNNLLIPILDDTLGLQLGQTEVNLLGLSCTTPPALVE